jgi:hypothetical protein
VLVRPEFEPTLPALVRRRTGLPERATIALLLLAIAVLAAALLLVRPQVDGVATLVHRDDPAFNLEYASGALDEVDPRAGELARLEGRRGRQAVTITVRPLELPAYEGDVAHGLLPTYASGHIRELASELDRFQLRTEHRARINDAPGYEIRFRTGAPGSFTFGTDTLLVPDEEESRGGLLLSMRREVDGPVKLSDAEKDFSDQASEAFRSLYFGTGRG